MARSTRLWLEIAACGIAITAFLGIAALAMRVSLAGPHAANSLAAVISIFTVFFCVFVGIAVSLSRERPDDSKRLSIQDELDSRKQLKWTERNC